MAIGFLKVEIDKDEYAGFIGRLRQLITRGRKLTAEQMEDLANRAFDSIQEKTPVLTGRAIEAWKLIKRSPFNYTIINNVDYVVYLEYGTKPHLIYPKNAAILAWVNRSTGETIFSQLVQHPGTRPYAMVRTTLSELRKDMKGFVSNLAADIFGDEGD